MAWRAQSVKIVLWFGDAPGHDPSGGVSLSRAVSDLRARGIVVHPIDSGALNSRGQARRVANATGGRTWRVENADRIARSLIDAVGTTLERYSEVRLEFGEEPLGLGITITPDRYTGDFRRDADRTFEFEMRLEAFKPGLYEFEVDALVDGAAVATERDRIEIPNRQPARRD